MHQYTKLLFINTILIWVSSLHASQIAKVAQATRTQEEQQKLNDTFIMAMMNIYDEPAKKVLADGADVNAKTKAGDTLLILWLKGINLMDYQWFLDQGPSPFVKNAKNKNGYDYGYSRPKLFNKLLEHRVHKLTATSELCKVFVDTPIYTKDLVAIIQEYARCGPTTENLNDALFKSIVNFYDDQVEYFLSYGADCNARDDEQQTPLMYVALLSRDKKILESDFNRSSLLRILVLLFEYGADTTLQDKYNNTALMHAKIRPIGFPTRIARLLEDHENAQLTAQKNNQ